jgi:hypothetical protein
VAGMSMVLRGFSSYVDGFVVATYFLPPRRKDAKDAKKEKIELHFLGALCVLASWR